MLKGSIRPRKKVILVAKKKHVWVSLKKIFKVSPNHWVKAKYFEDPDVRENPRLNKRVIRNTMAGEETME